MATKTSRVRTDTLMRRIVRASTLADGFQQNEASMQTETFRDCLEALCRDRKLVAEKAIRQSGIDRSYGHQLFNGTRQPSRDKVLQLAIGMRLTVEETQRLLRSAGKSALYPRLRRDAVVLYGLGRAMSVMEVQSLLTHYDLTQLGGMKHD